MCNYLLTRLFDWLLPPRPGSFSEWISAVGLAFTASAFSFGLWQYQKSQIWKRLEFVSAQMKIFFDDRAVRATMHMLDWRRKKFPLYNFRNEDDDEEVTVVYADVAAALGISPTAHYGKKHSAIREAFERFLEYIARFEGFLDEGAVKPKDLNPGLDYWVKLLSGHDTHSPEVTQEVLPTLWKFMWLGTHTDTSSRLEARRHREGEMTTLIRPKGHHTENHTQIKL